MFEFVIRAIKIGCNTNICEESEFVTPLHVSVTVYGDPDEFEAVLQILVAGGCHLDAHCLNTRETALYRALDIDRGAIAEILLQHGADPYIDCPHDMTILNKACQRGLTSFVRLLALSSFRWVYKTFQDISYSMNTVQFFCL